MIKQYTSKSHISISVKLQSGYHKHISFNQMTGSGSVYYTDNEEIQKALESHPKFGKLFYLGSLSDRANKVKTKSSGSSSAKPKKDPEAVKDKEIIPVAMSTLADGKEYLAKKYNISRTQLRTREEIDKAGAQHGILFIWGDDR